MMSRLENHFLEDKLGKKLEAFPSISKASSASDVNLGTRLNRATKK